jgi:tetratricopeptide (TPR) repeat protein
MAGSQFFFWPEELKKDKIFDDSDIFVLDYPTSMWAKLSIDELSDNIKKILGMRAKVDDYTNIVFVAHSMGGLLTKSYLLRSPEIARKTKFIYLYATPSGGSEIARIARLVSGNPQFSNMSPMKDDSFLGDLLRQWTNAKYNVPVYCAYEKLPVANLSIIVNLNSSALTCKDEVIAINSDHISIVKPRSRNDMAYMVLESAYDEAFHGSESWSFDNCRDLADEAKTAIELDRSNATRADELIRCKNPAGYNAKGIVDFFNGSYSNAYDEFREVVKFFPRKGTNYRRDELRDNIASAAIEIGRLDEAEQIYRDLLDGGYQPDTVRWDLAKVYIYKGKFDRESYLKAIRMLDGVNAGFSGKVARGRADILRAVALAGYATTDPQGVSKPKVAEAREALCNGLSKDESFWRPILRKEKPYPNASFSEEIKLLSLIDAANVNCGKQQKRSANFK